MKFGLDIRLNHNDGSVALAEVGKSAELAQAVFAKPEDLEGSVVPVANGKTAMEPVDDPLLPLLESWMLKVPWLLQGDTETVYMKNSEHAFGFEVVNESVALSFYKGQGNEVDEYVMEPFNITLDAFCGESVTVVRQLLNLIKQANPASMQSVADVRTLQEATLEAERALKEYRLDRR